MKTALFIGFVLGQGILLAFGLTDVRESVVSLWYSGMTLASVGFLEWLRS